MTEIDTFILIGGRSTRFGSDKAFAEVDGEPLALRAARVARTAFPNKPVRFVAASKDQFGSKLAELNGTAVYDIRPGFGAWSGVHTALANSSAEWTLVLACDLPFVNADLLQTLATATEGGVDAVVPRQADGRLQPLCTVYRTKAALAAAEEFFADDEHLPPLQSLFNRLKTVILDVADDSLRNLNTPSDLV